ncbi:glycosyltransferase [Sphingomonas sp. 37zxx]|uniref:glycosyltransferase n=1 Tax=Sphingomonas sp. 37zxx TaxID=1550073 RepID=UPI0006911DD0|nr:glycosyltransferase [Sphingomonas sp. 37zxx]
MAKPRILFILNSLAGGGAERVVLSLLDLSADLRDRYDFSLALLDRETPDYSPPTWLTVHQLDAQFGLAQSVKQLRALVAQVQPDATFAFLVRSNLASIIVARLAGHKAIISERANTSGHFPTDLKGRLSRLMVRLLYPRADHIVSVSAGIADDLVQNFGVSADRITTIPNPVRADAIRASGAQDPAWTSERPYAVAVSRLAPNKNVALVLDGLARADTNVALAVMGQGPERERLEVQAAALGIADRVHFLGFQSNPYAIMARAAFYVSGSNAEGFPNGLVEALALGIPVLSTNCPSGPSEILADSAREAISGLTIAPYGILTPPNDADSMARGMEAALEPGLSAELVAAGPKRAAEYAPLRVRDAYWGIVEKVLAKKGGRS